MSVAGCCSSMWRSMTGAKSASCMGVKAPLPPLCQSKSNTTHSRNSSSRQEVVCRAQRAQAQIAVDPCPAMNTNTCRDSSIVVGAVSAVAAVSVYHLMRLFAERTTRAKLPEVPDIPPRPDKDPRAYQMALARSRQASHVHHSVAYMHAGEPARAMVELGRALQENAVCRSPLIDGTHPKSSLSDLYRLHIKNSEVPPNFAVLLQLRDMLGLSAAEADAIEQEVMNASEAFSI